VCGRGSVPVQTLADDVEHPLTRIWLGMGVPRAQVARAFVLALVCLGSVLGRAGAQSWAVGYPKLQFGAAALSPSLSFPASLGSWIPTGGSPQDVILRFKVSDADSAAHFTAGKVTIEHVLSGFKGGDNVWSGTSTDLKALLISAAGNIASASDRLAASTATVQWTARSSTLTVMLDNVQAADISDAEIAIVLAAASFVGGKGPVAPDCLERDAPFYVKKVVKAQGAEVLGLRGALQASAPVGCFGIRATGPFGVTADRWDQKAIGQNAKTNGVGMDMTITVTLASSRDVFSVTASVKSEVVISGLVGSQTSDTSALALEVYDTDLFSALDLFETPAEAVGTANTVNTGRWKQETGTLTLTIKDGKRLSAGIPFVFSFKLKLPKFPSVSNDVYVMAKTGTTTVIPNQRMDSASGDAAPLATRARTFIVARIGQLVSGRGQENTLQITLMSNFDVQSTTSSISKITVSGLTGSASPDSSPQNLYSVVSKSKDSVQGVFSDSSAVDRAGWFKNKGELVLHIEMGRFLRAGTEYVFALYLLNQDKPQESPVVHVQVSGETDTGRIEMQRGDGIEAPLLISEPAMSIAEVSPRPCC
jgi:hypothetical protein